MSPAQRLDVEKGEELVTLKDFEGWKVSCVMLIVSLDSDQQLCLTESGYYLPRMILQNMQAAMSTLRYRLDLHIQATTRHNGVTIDTIRGYTIVGFINRTMN